MSKNKGPSIEGLAKNLVSRINVSIDSEYIEFGSNDELFYSMKQY